MTNSTKNRDSKKNFVVFASGSGSNFQSLINAVECGDIDADIRCLVVDRPCAAIKYAQKNSIDFYVVHRKNNPTHNQAVLSTICKETDLIVCAGYLSIIPEALIVKFQNKIINIHPSLLPKFGGTGMYGMNVHRAVIAAGEMQSGCTVHYVDNEIDTGEIIEQVTVNISRGEDPDSLQKKILLHEHQLLPAVVQQLINN